MKCRTFTILSSFYVVCTRPPIWVHHMGSMWIPHEFHVDTTWYTHMVNRCETHMGKPYVCYMSAIWLTHMTPIWVVGCKPHEIPYVYHIVFLYCSHMDSIRRWSYVVCSTLFCSWHSNNTVHIHYRHLLYTSNQIKYVYFRQLYIPHFLTSYCNHGKANEFFFALTYVTIFKC